MLFSSRHSRIVIESDSNTQSFTGHLDTLDASSDLLERDVARKVRRAMLRLEIDAERAEAAVVRRAKLVYRDVLRCRDELSCDLFWRLDLRIERIDDANEGDL